MSDELKSCPHCGAGGERIILQEHPARAPGPSLKAMGLPDYPCIWTIECPTENCATMIADTREAVVAAWNRRPESDELKPHASIDSPELRSLLDRLIDAAEAGQNASATARGALIAHIDAWGARLAESHLHDWLNGGPDKVAAAPVLGKEDA